MSPAYRKIKPQCIFCDCRIIPIYKSPRTTYQFQKYSLKKSDEKGVFESAIFAQK